jgi:hypothetical protein
LAEHLISLGKAAKLLRIPLPLIEAGLKGPLVSAAIDRFEALL